MIWILLMLSVVIFLIVTSVQNDNAKKEHSEKIDLAQKQLTNSTKNFENAIKPILELIIIEYGESLAEKVSKEIITINMPSELLIISWGNPADIKTKIHKDTKTEYWYYNSFYNRLGNLKVKKEVILENNKISGWKDLV